jgi:hypothetical protein
MGVRVARVGVWAVFVTVDFVLPGLFFFDVAIR